MSAKQIKLQNSIKKTVDEMNKLEKSMQQMKDAKVPTEEYAALQKACEQAEKKLNGYLATEDRMKATGQSQNTQTWKNLQYNIDEARKTVQAYQADMESMKADGTAFQAQDVSGMEQKYEGLKGKLQELKAAYREAGGAEGIAEASGNAYLITIAKIGSACGRVISSVQKLSSLMVGAFKKVLPIVGKVASAIGSVGGKILGAINPMKALKRHTDSCSTGIGKFANRMLRIVKTAFVFSIFRNGFNKLREHLGAMLMTNNQFASSIAQIKGNLLTAFQPIYEACLPAINALASGLATVCGYIAQFTSMLFGKSLSASQAAAKAQYKQVQAYKDTGKSAKKAGKDAKEAQKQLSDIDELHVVNDNNNDKDSGSGSGVNAPDFTTGIDTSSGVSDFVKKLKEAWNTADFTEIGEIIANKINNALVKIPWGAIQTTASKIGQSLATFINGACNVKELWNTLGTTIGEGINTAIILANTFVAKLDWSNLGNSIGIMIDNAIKTIDWNKLGNTFGKYFTGIFSAIDSCIKSINFKSAGKKVGNGLKNLIKAINFNKIGETFADGINGIANFINNLYAKVDFKGLGKKIAGGLNKIMSTTDWKNVGTALGNGFNTAIDTLYGLIKSFSWTSLGTSVATGLNNVLTTTNWSELITGASNLVKGIMDSVTTFFTTFDFQGLGKMIGESFCKIDWGGIASGAIDLLIAGFNGLISTVVGVAQSLGKNIAEGLAKGISIVDIIKNTGKWIHKHIFKPFIDNFKKLFGIHSPSTVMAELGGYLVAGLKKGITDLWGNFIKFVGGLAKKIVTAFGDLKDAFIKKGSRLVSGLKSGITSAWSSFISFVGGLPKKISSAFGDLKNTFVEKGGKLVSGLKSGISSAWSGFTSFVGGLPGKISSAFGSLVGIFKTKGGQIISGIKSGWTNGWNSFSSWLGGRGKAISSAIGNIKDKFLEKGGQIISGIKSGWTNGWGSFKGWLGTIPGSIKSGIGTLKDVGGNLVSGLWEGINDKTKWLCNKINSFGKSVTSSIKKFFGIHSPSRLFRDEIGTYLAQGIGVGFNDEMSSVTKNMEKSLPASMIDFTGLPVPSLATGTVPPANYGNYVSTLNNMTDLSSLESKLDKLISLLNSNASGNVQNGITVELTGEMSRLFSAFVKQNKDNKDAGRTSFVTT